MSVPSKRRRTSPSTYVSVNADGEGDSVLQITPKRASYLSPTKASLARSNPGLLPKIADAQARRESSPHRRQSLKDAVLSSRSEEVREPAVIADKEQQPDLRAHDVKSHNLEPAKSVTISSETEISDKPVEENVPHEKDFRSPFKTRQSSVYTPRHRRHIPPVKAPKIIPTLVHSSSKSTNSEIREKDTEEELPPTPVELGSDQRPHRPRGLASSSPGGVGRRRVRVQGGVVTSSPLKPRAPPPEPSKAPDYVEIASGLDREEEQDDDELVDLNKDKSREPRSDIMIEPAEDVNHVSEEYAYSPEAVESSNSRNQLKALQRQLQKLKAECIDLENLSTTISKSSIQSLNWTTLDSSLEVLLSSAYKAHDPLHPPLESHELFRKNSTKFMTLFSPGSLVMSYETWEKNVKGARKFVYETTFAAPRPWPSEIFNLTFETTLDLDSDTIEHIRFKRVGDTPSNEELDKWINAQLENPVMRCDLATIVTGAGRYLEADIERARLLRKLNDRCPSADTIAHAGDGYLATSGARTEPGRVVTTEEEALGLLPFLGKTQIAFSEATGQTRHKTRRSASSVSVKEVMLVYGIELNWIGNPTRAVSIVVSGYTDKASQHARKMFREIEQVKGIMPAFESVWGILGIDREVQNENGTSSVETKDAKGKERGKHRKSTARRMTEFN